MNSLSRNFTLLIAICVCERDGKKRPQARGEEGFRDLGFGSWADPFVNFGGIQI